MCLYPKLTQNRKYMPNKKNGGNPPPVTDPRTTMVPVGCGKCMECMKQRTNNWRTRLIEDIRHNKNGKFITMTFSEEALTDLESEIHRINQKNIETFNRDNGTKLIYKPVDGYELENAIATIAVRRFLERYRKEYKTSIRHWIVTELGQEKTERLHLHGIIWTDKTKKTIENIWKYGNVNKKEINWEKNYVNEATVNYIVKYINKIDTIHKYYRPIILCSSGIGKDYLNRSDSTKNKFKGDKTDETYKTRQGIKTGLPKYYRNKIYDEDQKEKLWINLLDKQVRYVNGIKIDISKGEEDYENILKSQRMLNDRLGYGNDRTNWDEAKDERQRRNIQRWTRIEKIKNRKNKDK